MVYIITGKNSNDGVIGNDSGDLNKYFELGWELMVTRIYLLKMLKEGKVNKDIDVVVTFPDRKFLYTSLFKNVISFKEYLNDLGPIKKRGSALSTIDLVSKAMSIISNPRTYNNLIPDYVEFIKNIEKADISKFNVSEKFLCLLIRTRDWCSERNGDINYYLNLLKELNEKNIRVFLGGLGTEKYVIYDNIKHTTLQEWATLMGHPNCMAVIGDTSGSSVLLGQICCNNKILINDFSGVSLCEENFKHPLLCGKQVHFSNVPVKVYLTPPTLEQILFDVENHTWKP